MHVEIWGQLFTISLGPKVCKMRLEEAGSWRVEHSGTSPEANGDGYKGKEQRSETRREQTQAQGVEPAWGAGGRGFSRGRSGLC